VKRGEEAKGEEDTSADKEQDNSGDKYGQMQFIDDLLKEETE